MNLNELKKQILNPSAEYRSIPFYSLNGALDPGEVRTQAEDMIDHGMGGFFLHSREGLETEYMADEWMASVRAAVEGARAKGGFAWLYDEDRFPSGGAGGNVPRANPAAFSAKAITMELGAHAYAPDALAVFAVRVECGTLISARALTSVECVKDGEVLAVFRVETSAPCEWFNDQAPSDNLNPDAVRAFIGCTHEKYRALFADDFGGAIKGIFTDEPNIADFRASYTPGRQWLPWTDGFAEYFVERRARALVPLLPWLFIPGKESFSARHDYWKTITERFVEAYSMQVFQWCEQNGLIYTGHYMREDSLAAGTRMSGAVMPHYVFEHMPGIDMLTGDGRELLTARQCASVANQLGRRSICEMYGCSGWEFTFEGQKRAGDWLFAMGIDTRCQHHALYTFRGCAKRDYPPSFNYNSVWWPHNRTVEDYFARLSAALAGGRAERPVLIIHPQASAWGVTGAGYCKDYQWHTDDTEANQLQSRLESMLAALAAEHVDYDFGDEITLERIGGVRGRTLIVGQMEYGVVVLPYIATISSFTLSLLERFLANGGRVFAVGGAPARVDGKLDGRASQLAKCVNFMACETASTMVNALLPLVPERARFIDELGRDTPEILALIKNHGDYRALFAVNQSLCCAHDVTVSVPEAWARETLFVDSLTGKTHALSPTESKDGRTLFPLHMAAGESLLLLLLNKASDVPCAPARAKTNAPDRTLSLPLTARVVRTHPNCLLLDECRWRLNGGPWQAKEQVWSMQNRVRAALGMRQIYRNGSPQRYRWAHLPCASDGARLEMEFEFFVESVPASAVRLAAESAKRFEIALNGDCVTGLADAWYLDKCVQTIPLPALKPGKNTLTLLCDYKNSDQLEDCFLIGDFAVTPARAIARETGELRIGDWCLQGYLHYAGALVYRFRVRVCPNGRARLYIGKYEGVTACARVNGAHAGDVPWHSADGLEITGLLKDGDNEIDIEIVGSQRNLMGLFHQVGRQNVWVDWTFFDRADSRTDPEYALLPYGLMERPYVAFEDSEDE